jgi:hypothetical protein
VLVVSSDYITYVYLITKVDITGKTRSLAKGLVAWRCRCGRDVLESPTS